VAADEENDHRTAGREILEKVMWTAGYTFRWRKMEAAVQNRAGSGKEWFHTAEANSRPILCWPMETK